MAKESKVYGEFRDSCSSISPNTPKDSLLYWGKPADIPHLVPPGPLVCPPLHKALRDTRLVTCALGWAVTHTQGPAGNVLWGCTVWSSLITGPRGMSLLICSQRHCASWADAMALLTDTAALTLITVCDHLNSWPLRDLAPTLWPSLEVYGTPTCLFSPCFIITLIWNVWCFVMLYDNIWPFLKHDRYGKMGGNVDQQLKRQSENVLEGSLLVSGKHSSHNTRYSSAQQWWK